MLKFTVFFSREFYRQSSQNGVGSDKILFEFLKKKKILSKFQPTLTKQNFVSTLDENYVKLQKNGKRVDGRKC